MTELLNGYVYEELVWLWSAVSCWNLSVTCWLWEPAPVGRSSADWKTSHYEETLWPTSCILLGCWLLLLPGAWRIKDFQVWPSIICFRRAGWTGGIRDFMRVSLSRHTSCIEITSFCEVVKAGGLHTLKPVLLPSSLLSESKCDCFCDAYVDVILFF